MAWLAIMIICDLLKRNILQTTNPLIAWPLYGCHSTEVSMIIIPGLTKLYNTLLDKSIKL